MRTARIPVLTSGSAVVAASTEDGPVDPPSVGEGVAGPLQKHAGHERRQGRDRERRDDPARRSVRVLALRLRCGPLSGTLPVAFAVRRRDGYRPWLALANPAQRPHACHVEHHDGDGGRAHGSNRRVGVEQRPREGQRHQEDDQKGLDHRLGGVGQPGQGTGSLGREVEERQDEGLHGDAPQEVSRRHVEVVVEGRGHRDGDLGQRARETQEQHAAERRAEVEAVVQSVRGIGQEDAGDPRDAHRDPEDEQDGRSPQVLHRLPPSVSGYRREVSYRRGRRTSATRS
jgi:hypothetical protein